MNKDNMNEDKLNSPDNSPKADAADIDSPGIDGAASVDKDAENNSAGGIGGAAANNGAANNSAAYKDKSIVEVQELEEIFEEITVAEKTLKFEKHLKKILIACSILLLGEVLYFFIITPAMPLAHIEITGAEGLEKNGMSKAALLDYLGVSSGTSYFGFNTDKVRQKLMQIPQVDSVDLNKKFPDTARIDLHLRKPAALSLAFVNGRSELVIYDKEGVVFEVGNNPQTTLPPYVPLISGLGFQKAVPGLRLPDFLQPLLNDINVLQETNPELLSTLSEIRINRRAFENFDLTLYPVHKKVRIRTQPELKEKTLTYILLLLDVLDERGVNVNEIDFRTGTATYIE